MGEQGSSVAKLNRGAPTAMRLCRSGKLCREFREGFSAKTSRGQLFPDGGESKYISPKCESSEQKMQLKGFFTWFVSIIELKCSQSYGQHRVILLYCFKLTTVYIHPSIPVLQQK